MTESTYDYTFTCTALENLVPTQKILVAQWHGTEAVSQPYRFEVTVAVRGDNLALETLLDQSATLSLRKPDGSAARWHGIVTQAGQYGHDETYDYYQLVLEPRLVRLGLRSWSDIYLGQQLDQLIVSLLDEIQLTVPYKDDETPYDYRIVVPNKDLTAMRREFACQFEESCLAFLMRKLEFYGVYFWFEQGEECESIIFGNDALQQPQNVDTAIYYPKGALDPSTRDVVVTRMDRHVAMRPATVTLRAMHEETNVRQDMKSEADVEAIPHGQGETQSIADHFSVLEDVETGNSVPGATLAQWRAQELACSSLGVQGEARTPGMLVGRFVAVSEYSRQSGAAEYYVLRVEHEGTQALDGAPMGDEPAYLAHFTALPRWRNQDDQSGPIQFRPPRKTPVPHITRLLSGFVDTDQNKAPQRYAQPDAAGHYKVRLGFVRRRYDGYLNSAWLRMSSPYAGGSAQAGLAEAGMHFPLREGTEVLIAFLNGDPDRPVIVGTLPNEEAPSVVKQDNARQHVLRTPNGNCLTMQDGDPQAAETSGDNEIKDDTYVRMSTPNTSAMLNLGSAPNELIPDLEDSEESGDNDEEIESIHDGFLLRTEKHGQIHAGESMLIEVPGNLRICAGGPDALAGFLGSAVSLCTGVSASQSGGIVFENFTGAKFELAESTTNSLKLSFDNSVQIGTKFDSFFGFALSVGWAPSKDIALRGKKVMAPDAEDTSVNWVSKCLNRTLYSKEEDMQTLSYAGTAYQKYEVKSRDISITTLGTGYGFKADLQDTSITAMNEVDISAANLKGAGKVKTTLSGGNGQSTLSLEGMGAKLSGTFGVDINAGGSLRGNGKLIQLG